MLFYNKTLCITTVTKITENFNHRKTSDSRDLLKNREPTHAVTTSQPQNGTLHLQCQPLVIGCGI